MEVLVEKYDLQKALSLCLSVIEKKATMPILSNVLLSAKDNELTLSASDLEITAVTTIPAKVKSGGETTVNSKVFGDIVRELTDGKVAIELTEGERIEVKAGGASLKILGVSADEYPSLPGIGINVTSRISATQFLDMINKTIYASSDDETCFNLTGVYFCNDEDKFTMVATDGNRISVVARDIPGLDIKEGVIVPKKGLSEIRKFLSDLEDAEIGIGINDGFLIIDTQSTKLSMRLIDGDFPNYSQVVPKSSDLKATIPTKDFYKAIRRVSILVTDKMKGVKLSFDSDSLMLSSSSKELGEGIEKINVKYNGEPLEVAFNSAYMQDIAMSVGETEELDIELNGSLGAGKITTQKDPGYYAVIMPMRLS